MKVTLAAFAAGLLSVVSAQAAVPEINTETPCAHVDEIADEINATHNAGEADVMSQELNNAVEATFLRLDSDRVLAGKLSVMVGANFEELGAQTIKVLRLCAVQKELTLEEAATAVFQFWAGD